MLTFNTSHNYHDKLKAVIIFQVSQQNFYNDDDGKDYDI